LSQLQEKDQDNDIKADLVAYVIIRDIYPVFLYEKAVVFEGLTLFQPIRATESFQKALNS